MTEHDPVNHPTHYTSHPSGIECLQITRLLPFDLGNAVKYVWRADLKNGQEDLRKSEFYLSDEIKRVGTVAHYLDLEPEACLLLQEAAKAETSGYRSVFFWAISAGDLVTALRGVQAMIVESVGGSV